MLSGCRRLPLAPEKVIEVRGLMKEVGRELTIDPETEAKLLAVAKQPMKDVLIVIQLHPNSRGPSRSTETNNTGIESITVLYSM